MKIKFLLFLLLFLSSQLLVAQAMTAEQYIAKYKDIAIFEMRRMGVPAAISLAQGLLETENGNSDLLKKSNNHFGIKCKSNWTAQTVNHDDDAPGECFRAYKTAEDSYRDHSDFLRTRANYAFLFKLDPTDYRAWAYGLRKAGYATNPRYPQILIKNIEDNNLEQYTQEAIDMGPITDSSQYEEAPAVIKIQDTSTEKVVSVAVNSIPGTAKLIINGSNALWVPKGTSLLAIATKNNINLGKLLEINELDKDGLLPKDQYIFLEKKHKEGDRDYYIIQQDETLYDVAQKNGIVLQSLYDFNRLAPGENVYPGTKIRLRSSIVKQVSDTNTAVLDRGSEKVYTSTELKVHAVQPKENLFSISRRYGISVDQLKEWNNLKDNNLTVGQQLIISK